MLLLKAIIPVTEEVGWVTRMDKYIKKLMSCFDNFYCDVFAF